MNKFQLEEWKQVIRKYPIPVLKPELNFEKYLLGNKEAVAYVNNLDDDKTWTWAIHAEFYEYDFICGTSKSLLSGLFVVDMKLAQMGYFIQDTTDYYKVINKFIRVSI